MMSKRSIIYIDGFNLYYGLVKDTPYRWLDLEKYFNKLLPDDEIQKIYYFTALVNGNHQRARQEKYLGALENCSLIEIVYGKFKRKRLSCRVNACSYQGDKFFPSQEEKRTDVNIAVQMIDDAYRDECEKFVIVSGDSDLAPAIARIKQRFPEKKVAVYIPARDSTRGAATEIRSVADHHRLMPLNLLSISQFPKEVVDGSGNRIQKPTSW